MPFKRIHPTHRGYSYMYISFFFMHIWKGGYVHICIVFSSSIPNFVTSMLSGIHDMKVQQQDSAAEGIRTNQPLDSPGARPRWSKSWRRFECDFISMWYIYIKILQTVSCFWKVQAVVGYLPSPSITCSLFLWLASSTLKFIWNFSVILSNVEIAPPLQDVSKKLLAEIWGLCCIPS